MIQRIPIQFLAILFFVLACGSSPKPGAIKPTSSVVSKPEMQGPEPTMGHPALVVTSSDFASEGRIAEPFAFNQFGCTGENLRPELSWTSVPEGTKGFAVIVHDPDAPTGVGFFHWVAINIPRSVTSLGASLPPSVKELHTDYGAPGYGGPCPPEGRTHRYVFSVYALDVAELPLPPGATGALTRFVLASHTLALGRLVGRYGR